MNPRRMKPANGSTASGSCRVKPRGISHSVPLAAISRKAETTQMARPNPREEPAASTSAATGRLVTENPPAR